MSGFRQTERKTEGGQAQRYIKTEMLSLIVLATIFPLPRPNGLVMSAVI